MTRGVVLDASAAIAMLRDEPEGVAVEQALATWKQARVRLLVPEGFWLEIVNVLIRRHRWPAPAVLQAIHELDTIDFVSVPSDRPHLLLALDLGERHGLTSYDAAYLATAISADARLLTRDRDLAIAAGDRAVPLDGGHRLHETPAPYEHDVTWPSYQGAAAFLAALRAEALAGRATYERPSPSAVPGPRR